MRDVGIGLCGWAREQDAAASTFTTFSRSQRLFGRGSADAITQEACSRPSTVASYRDAVSIPAQLNSISERLIFVSRKRTSVSFGCFHAP